MPLISSLRKILRHAKRALTRYEPLITISISKERLLHNIRTYRDTYPGMGIAPVLKSNAYGHGLVLIAELLDTEGVTFFMVDSYYEARVLRRAGIHSKIVVMGYVRPEYIASSALRDTEYAITDIEQLRSLVTLPIRKARIHLKIDTGMHRQGIMPSDLKEAIELIKHKPGLEVVGVGTHLADADNTDPEFTTKQLKVWEASLQELDAAFPTITYRHAAATKGASLSGTHPMNVIRVGMGLYGYDTATESTLSLKPVLSMHSSITSIRTIPAGDAVGYNATFVATRTSSIATVPAGYYEGIDRRLSNKGVFHVGKELVPLCGRVSMNMMSLDVTDASNAKRGDTVTLISDNPEDPNSAQAIARLAETTPYVILAHLPSHLYRRVS